MKTDYNGDLQTMGIPRTTSKPWAQNLDSTQPETAQHSIHGLQVTYNPSDQISTWMPTELAINEMLINRNEPCPFHNSSRECMGKSLPSNHKPVWDLNPRTTGASPETQPREPRSYLHHLRSPRIEVSLTKLACAFSVSKTTESVVWIVQSTSW